MREVLPKIRVDIVVLTGSQQKHILQDNSVIDTLLEHPHILLWCITNPDLQGGSNPRHPNYDRGRTA